MTKPDWKQICVVATAAAIFIVYLCARGCSHEPKKRFPPTRGINTVLTNEMSEFEGDGKLSRDVSNFMSRWSIKGLSLSVTRNDSLLFARGFGQADDEVPMGPGNIMRIASVSKLFTAVGIMKLQEQGRLRLSDKVFGADGILNDTTFTNAIKDRNYFKINVEHLLRHEAGFSVRKGDPMFITRDIMALNHLDTPPDHETLVRLMLRQKLWFTPGESEEYSNFGYLLLSMIIEKVTGQDYEEWMQANVLEPAGVLDMHIAGNTYEDKYPNEVRYYMQANDPTVPKFDNSGEMVVRCYGGSDIHSLSGAGAWMASTPELARFVASIDGRKQLPDILNIRSVRAMTDDFGNHRYGIGWSSVDGEQGWLRTGSLAGTNLFIMLYPDGECWVMGTNTHNWKGPRFSGYVRQFISECRRKYSGSLPSRNLFEAEATK